MPSSGWRHACSGDWGIPARWIEPRCGPGAVREYASRPGGIREKRPRVREAGCIDMASRSHLCAVVPLNRAFLRRTNQDPGNIQPFSRLPYPCRSHRLESPLTGQWGPGANECDDEQALQIKKHRRKRRWGARLTCRPECSIVGFSGMTRVPAIDVDQLREVLAWTCLRRLARNPTERVSLR
jgi:hypothetical protein